MKTAIRFIQSYGVYNKGEIAGFEPGLAEELIGQRKVAVMYDPKQSEVAAADLPDPDAENAKGVAKETGGKEDAVASRALPKQGG